MVCLSYSQQTAKLKLFLQLLLFDHISALVVLEHKELFRIPDPFDLHRVNPIKGDQTILPIIDPDLHGSLAYAKMILPRSQYSRGSFTISLIPKLIYSEINSKTDYKGHRHRNTCPELENKRYQQNKNAKTEGKDKAGISILSDHSKHIT